MKHTNYTYEVLSIPESHSSFRFRFIAPNGRIVGHQYNSKSGAQRSLDAFLAAVRDGRVVKKTS